MNKKIGDIVWLHEGLLYKITNIPEIFKNDRLATEEEIIRYNEVHNSKTI